MDAVFVKTPKGREEIETKAHGLTPAIRRVLISIDGKRTLGELQKLPGVSDIHQVLNLLETEGYIARPAASPAPITPSPAAVASVTHSPEPVPATVTELPASNTPFRLLPEPPDPAQIRMARNFMVNTLTTFLGSFTVTALTKRLEACQNHAELRLLFEEWYQAILSSRQGRREGEMLRSKLLEII